MKTPSIPLVDVVVGLIEDGAGRWLVNQRRPGSHMAGSWEFPGGKREAGEARFAALSRELHEELLIEVTAAKPFMCLRHEYPDRRVELDIWLVGAYSGMPVANERQRLRWATPGELTVLPMLPADRPIIQAIASLVSSGRA